MTLAEKAALGTQADEARQQANSAVQQADAEAKRARAAVPKQ
jgi:hypothetical protein